jgi:hypothetical protein
MSQCEDTRDGGYRVSVGDRTMPDLTEEWTCQH